MHMEGLYINYAADRCIGTTPVSFFHVEGSLEGFPHHLGIPTPARVAAAVSRQELADNGHLPRGQIIGVF